MELSQSTQALVLAVLGTVAGLMVLARVARVPYPIFLLVGGISVALIPGVPDVELAPEVVLLAALPPLLYAAAFFSSLNDMRENARPISLLAVGLVLATTVIVAVVAHAAVGLAWAPAFVLGAVVSPTDPLAATAIARRLGAPRRVVTIIEGESLVNDATALVIYRFAVAAVLTGSFSLLDAGLEFVWSAAGGVAVGLAVGWLVSQVRRRIEHPPTEIMISLVTAYFAFLPASLLGVSGVLAAVTTGIFLGWLTPKLVTPSTRMQSAAVWETLVFVLNSLLFVLVGLQLPRVVDGLSGVSAATLIGYAALMSATVIVVRLVFVFVIAYAVRYVLRWTHGREPLGWRNVAVVGWAGMRGAVALAAALAIPLETDAGGAFPERDLVVFLTFSVIVATLVFQGLTLPAIIRALGVEDDGLDRHEESKARYKAAVAAIARIDELTEEEWVREDTAERMKRLYEYRRRRFGSRFDENDDGAIEEQSLGYQRLRREALEAERSAIVELRNRGVINDEVMRRVERDLDLEDVRLEI